MPNVTSSKAAQLWAERIAQCQQSNLSAPKFCQSIGCSLTSFYQWKRKLAASPKQSNFLRVQTSEPTKDSIEIKLPSGISILVPVSAVDSIVYQHLDDVAVRNTDDFAGERVGVGCACGKRGEKRSVGGTH